MAIIRNSRTGGKRKGAGRPRSVTPKKTFSFWASATDVALITEEYGTIGKLVEAIAKQLRERKMVSLLREATSR